MIYTKDMLTGLRIDSTPDEKIEKEKTERRENFRNKRLLWDNIKKNIKYTKLLSNSIDEDFYDYYIKEEDYNKYKNELNEMTSNHIEKQDICGIIFYKFPEYFI